MGSVTKLTSFDDDSLANVQDQNTGVAMPLSCAEEKEQTTSRLCLGVKVRAEEDIGIRLKSALPTQTALTSWSTPMVTGKMMQK